MSHEIVIRSKSIASVPGGIAIGFTLPATIADQVDKAVERFFTFFTDTIPNPNTRTAYYCNAMRFFAWTAKKKLNLLTIKGYHVSAYLAELTLTGKEQPASTPTVKQHLAALTHAVRLADRRPGPRSEPRRRRARRPSMW